MADIKISELTAVSSLNNGDLVEVSQVNELAPSGYTSLKASMADLGKKVNTDIEYTTDLADFTDKTTLGAIKETAKGKNIADEYDDTQTYDKGDVVIYKNTLYICTTNNTTGAWDATKWTATTVQSLIGSLSSLTTTNKDSLVEAVNSMVIKTNAAWTANSSSAYGTTLTDSINVTAGVWLITWGHPTQSATLGCFVDGIATNSDITDQFMSLDNGLANTKGCILVRFTGNSTIKLCAGGSASVSFSDIGRGFLRAVKLK